MKDAKATLLKILNTIGYTDDKGAFVNGFIKNIQLQSLLNLIQTLPSDKQVEVKQKLNNITNDPVEVPNILKIYFNDSQINESLKNTATDSVTKYIQSIQTTLSETQRNELVKVLEELGQGSTQATA